MVINSHRRQLLSAIAGTAIASLSGCSERSRETVFTYPSGFTEQGISVVEDAVGKNSEHYNSNSFTFQSQYRYDTVENNNTQTITEYSTVDGVKKHRYYRNETPNFVQEEFNDTKSYHRYAPKSNDLEDFTIWNAPFEKEKAYRINETIDFYSNVNFTVSNVVSDSLITYTAQLKDMPKNHPFLQQYKNIVSGEITFTLNSEGYIPNSKFKIIRRNKDGTKLAEVYSLLYSKYNTTVVKKPDWIKQAKNNSDTKPNGTENIRNHIM